MHIIPCHSLLAREINKAIRCRIKAIYSRIIGSYPDTMSGILGKSSYHVTFLSAGTGRMHLESVSHGRRRNIAYSPIESSYPDAALLIRSDAIHESLGRTAARIIHFRNHSPAAFLDIVLHQSIIATDQHVDIPVVIELVDVMHGIAYGGIDQLSGSTIGIHLEQSIVPGSHQNASIRIGEQGYSIEPGCISL